MRGSSDGDTGGMWWLGGGAADPPPPPERRHDAPPPPPERAYREISAAPNQTPPPLAGDSSPYSEYAHRYEHADEPPAALPSPQRASRPPVPPPPPLPASSPPVPPRRVAKRRHRATWPARLGLLLLAIIVGSVAVLVWRGGSVSGFMLPLGLGQPQPTPTRIGFAHQAKITFTRATQQLTAPSATLVAATDGSGQIKANVLTTSVTGAQSAPQPASHQLASQVTFTLDVVNTSSTQTGVTGPGITVSSKDGKYTCSTYGVNPNNQVAPNSSIQVSCATPIGKNIPAEQWDDTSQPPLEYKFADGTTKAGGGPDYYYVPSNCGSATPAETAAQQKLQSQLSIPSGSILLAGPSFNIDTSSLGCKPSPTDAAGQQSSQFTYVETINGTASTTVVATSDIDAFQTTQLQKAVPTNYILGSSQICPDGPKVATNATATKGTITCAATGIATWNWTPDALSQLAQSIAGLGVGSAALQLNQTQGIAPGSAKINLVDGSLLPDAANAITFAITP